jgi:hypothetical protein
VINRSLLTVNGKRRNIPPSDTGRARCAGKDDAAISLVSRPYMQATLLLALEAAS